MIDLTINEERLERAVKRAKEREIIIPTFAQMRNPAIFASHSKRSLLIPSGRIAMEAQASSSES